MLTPTQKHADLLLGGKLEDLLRDRRFDGVPFQQIRDELREHGVETTAETVRRWCVTFGIHEPVAS